MDTEVWQMLRAAVKSADRRVPRTGRRPRYSDAQIVKMYLWAVCHDRPLCWACDWDHYTALLRPSQLPSYSQFCRRVKSSRVQALLSAVNDYLTRDPAPGAIAILDGKPLAIGDYSRDPDARDGRGAGRFQRGYKLHALTSLDGRILRFAVRPLNVGEPNTAREALLAGIPMRAFVLADANYDSAALYQAISTRQSQLVTPLKGRSAQPRRRRSMGPARRTVLEWWEQRSALCRGLLRLRPHIERVFSALTCFGGGLTVLPAWVRRLDRVTRWVCAKIAIYHARLAIRNRSKTPA